MAGKHVITVTIIKPRQQKKATEKLNIDSLDSVVLVRHLQKLLKSKGYPRKGVRLKDVITSCGKNFLPGGPMHVCDFLRLSEKEAIKHITPQAIAA